MWFLMRSAFWFSLVWGALPTTGPEFSAVQVSAQAAAGLQNLCAANPKQCLATLSSLAESNPNSIPASLTPPAAKTAEKPVAKTKTADVKPAEAPKAKKAGTLTAQDLQPQWHAPKG